MSVASLLRSLRPSGGREAALFALAAVLVCSCAAAIVLWRHLAPALPAAADFQLDSERIEIEPAPRWLPLADLRREALRNASLDGRLSLLDDKLTERVGLAFAAHPWVEQVERVEKFHPARVRVRLRYRQPVASVAVGSRLLPIDRHGVVLPDKNFAPAELEKFPRITGILTLPAEESGAAWADDAVRGGAMIAAAFADDWHPLGLAEIYASSRPGTRGIHTTFVLVTVGGTAIPWGTQPPADQPSGELSAEEKVSRLRQYVRQHGSLDGVLQQSHTQDQSSPRTARDLPLLRVF